MSEDKSAITRLFGRQGGPSISVADPEPFIKTTELRRKAVAIAEITISFLEKQIERIREDGAFGDSSSGLESKMKELLAITKAIQSLEEIISKMDASINEASLYPQDAMEFHKQIEERVRKFSKL